MPKDLIKTQRTVVPSIDELLRHLLDKGIQPQSWSIQGLSRGAAELLLLQLMRSLSQSSAIPKLVLVGADERSLGSWTQSIATLAQMYFDEAKSPLAVGMLPAVHFWGSDRALNSLPFVHQRLAALDVLSHSRPGIVVTTLHGLLANTLCPEDFTSSQLKIKLHQDIDIEALVTDLSARGYLQRAQVEEEGQFAVRGGIVDIFSPQEEQPVRLEFFADTVSSLRNFLIEDQRSQAERDEICIIPALEHAWTVEERDQQVQRLYEHLVATDADPQDREGIVRALLNGHWVKDLPLFAGILRSRSSPCLDYLKSSTHIVFVDPIKKCEEAHTELLHSIAQQHALDARQRRPTLAPQQCFHSLQYFHSRLRENKFVPVELDNPIQREKQAVLSLAVEPSFPFLHSNEADRFDSWLNYFTEIIANDAGVVVLSSLDDQKSRIKTLLEHRHFNTTVHRGSLLSLLQHRQNLNAKVTIAAGDIATPVWAVPEKLLLVPEHALFGRKSNRQRSNARKLKNLISSFRDLQVGGLVVHVDHGIGRYLGLTKIVAGGAAVECLQIEYAGGDRVYLPVDRLRLLQRYTTAAGDENRIAAIDKLKSAGWQKRKSSVRKAVKDMAAALLEVQAKRELAKGLPLSTKTDDYYKFEAEFPFVETDDQSRAIGDVNTDLERQRPMDRLVCGDVGFGKTEVALRAAFRAVDAGYQVLVLVPTTVLCYQHYRTFSERMSSHNVRIIQANRFVKSLEIKRGLADLNAGSVDIAIGTHRLLSKDVIPKKLGLIIVDEEQRFGVAHKEALKRLRANCHVLTLTATPIPRTLHMAMLGLRDISIIATPPHSRVAVRTYISTWDETLVRDAISEEINRGGQVFFLHNRVEDIQVICKTIQALVPEASVRFAHGQMSEHNLEKTIVDFIENRFSVLVCTTIIESGVDMPNVNTLIVNNAHQFGLAQLYQIRGRVGRSSRQAYAYFMVAGEDQLSDDARQRLNVLSTYQELGSGFQVARHDMEIRGAGNLLGQEQSGRIDEVGLELYTDMLEQAMRDIRGKDGQERIDTEIKLPFQAFIPNEYIEDEALRLDAYKRLFNIDTLDELRTMTSELADRFGPVPPNAALLCLVAELKLLLVKCRALSLTRIEFAACEIKFASLNAVQIAKLTHVAEENPRLMQITSDFRLVVPLNLKWSALIEGQMDYCRALIERLLPLAHAMDNVVI